MKIFYKIVFFLVCLTLVLVTACAGKSPAVEKLDMVRLVGTIGPLSIPLAYMVENNRLSAIAEKTTFSIWANPTQLQAIVSGGQGDFISLPTNSAATFYNRGVSLKLLDSSIWNILYLVTADTSIRSITDLKGKRVVVPYQGAVPDAMFRYVCQQQGINTAKDLDIFYAPDPIQASQLLLSGREQYVLLSEPSATSVIINGRNSGLTLVRALNIKDEWQKSTGGNTSTPVAGTIALGELSRRPEILRVFVDEYRKAVQWMLDNPAEAGEVGARVLAEQGFKAGVLTESLQNIDWEYVPAVDARTSLEAFFNALSQVSPDFIGGKLPDDGFYFQP